jgi:ABC-type multidrug transport system fused ATPase/permease subunit
VIFAITIGAFSIINMGPSQQAIGKACGAAARLFSVCQSQATIMDGTKDLPSLAGRIAFENVTFSYPSRVEVPVLKNLSFNADEGQTVALVGSSGSGKSTCIQLILRYFDTSSGNVTLDGVPINELKMKWLRGNIGLVSQEPVLV